MLRDLPKVTNLDSVAEWIHTWVSQIVAWAQAPGLLRKGFTLQKLTLEGLEQTRVVVALGTSGCSQAVSPGFS